MLRNFLTISLRNLAKNGIFSVINILGLAIGMTCCILIMLWVAHENSFNNFHCNGDRIYQVMRNTPSNGSLFTDSSLPLPIVEALKSTEQSIQYVVPTDWGNDHLLTYKDNRLMLPGYYVGNDFLKVFSFKMKLGDANSALKDPSGIILTESSAKALFGNEDAMGKVIKIDDGLEMTVTGILEDVASNSSLQFKYIMPFSAYEISQPWVKRMSEQWNSNAFQVFVQLHEGSDAGGVGQRNLTIIQKYLPDTQHEIFFHPMSKWRLYSRFENGVAAGGMIEFVNSLSLVAGFILLIACINFMNLATARSERRAKEVGIRKTIGSRKTQLVMQFMVESLLITLMAFVVSLGLSEISIPFFNNLVNKDLSIPYSNLEFWQYVTVVICITAVVAGSYPAFFLSSFSPGAVLKGVVKGNVLPRKILVTTQFFLTIFQIVGTIVFAKQIQHGMDRELGYSKDNLVFIEHTADIAKHAEAIKAELFSKGLITSMTQSNSPITAVYANMNVSWPGLPSGEKASFATVATAYDYTKTTGIKMMSGRDFSPAYNDSSSVIINETAAKLMGLTDPLGAKILWEKTTLTIVGVAQDVIMTSPFRQVDPTMIIFDPSWIGHYTLRVPEGKDMQATINGLESVFKKYNPSYPFAYQFADDEYEKKFTSIRFIGKLANISSFLAIVISCLGLFGLAAFTAERRSKEIGIRKVLGASVSQMVILLSREFSALVIIAFVLASPGAWFFFNFYLQRFPYRIDFSWTILAGAGLVAMALALITVSSQALRAALANPVNALKDE